MKPIARITFFLFIAIAGFSGFSYGQDSRSNFCIAIRLNPQSLRQSFLSDNIPVHAFLPANLMVEALDKTDIEELTLLIGPAEKPNKDSVQDPASQLAIAMLIQCSGDIELDQLLNAWPGSRFVKSDQNRKPDPVRIQNQKCLKFPAGTFLWPKRKFGSLSFVDKNGNPVSRGLNVGYEYDYRSFIEGNSRSRAIYEFENLQKSDFANGTLPFGIRQQVFRTYAGPIDQIGTLIQLWSPEKNLVSEFKKIQSRSYAASLFDFKQHLSLSNTEGKMREGNVWNDLVDANQKLSVTVSGNQSGIYHGFGKRSLWIELPGNEFAFVNGNRLIVAQSKAALGHLMKLNPDSKNLLVELGWKGEQDVSKTAFQLNAKTTTQQERAAFENALHLFEIRDLMPDRMRGLRGVKFSLNHKDGACNGKIEFEKESLAKTFRWDLTSKWRKSWTHFAKEYRDRIIRRQVSGNLASIGFSGLSFSFPAQESDLKVALEKVVLIVDQWKNSLEISRTENDLNLGWKQPAFFSEQVEQLKVAITLLEETTSQLHFSREKFAKSLSLSRQALNRMPDETGLTMRLAHQHSFNESVSFIEPERRYEYIRRGIIKLLDHAEGNQDDLDALVGAGFFIAAKMGRSDEHRLLAPFFKRDTQLLEKISRIVDIKNERRADPTILGFTVANKIAEYAIKQHQTNAKSLERVPAWLLYSQPFLLNLDIALANDRGGNFEQSIPAWNEVKSSLEQLAKKDIPVGLGQKIRIGANQQSKEGSERKTEDLTKMVQAIRDQIRLEYWNERCELELTSSVRAARKTLFEMQRLKAGSDPEKELRLCQKCADQLLEVKNSGREKLGLIIYEFKDLSKRFQATSTALNQNISPDRKSILNQIDESKTPQRSVLGTFWTMPLWLPENKN